MDMGQLFHIAGRFWLRRDKLGHRTRNFGRVYPVRALPKVALEEGLITTWPVLTEVVHLASRWLGFERRPFEPLLG
jgi:hypothetical protein